ncbi:CDP-diacylglycerol--inositol 3-phosphatidyltransferase-like [Amphiura filiformis]|uniref:CDP-diacylglycerol--inositol 3-phosphatidyltransferase-like n=1 Tax=Amphiura filiformis TaxID=82378 RepID=UPI003B22532C
MAIVRDYMDYGGKRKIDVLLNAPNIICYVRAVLFMWGIWRALDHDYVFGATMWLANCALDEVDGKIARKFKQRSKFGELLDVILDFTVFEVGHKTLLCMIYPDFAFIFICHSVINIFTTWIYRQSCDITGADMYKSPNKILQLYEGVLGNCSIWGDWMFWLMLYLVYYTTGPVAPVINIGLWEILLWVCLPFTLIRFVVNVAGKLVTAVDFLVSVDIEKFDRNV